MNYNHIIIMDQLFAMGIMYGDSDYTTFTMLGDAQLPGQVFDVINRFEGTEDDYYCGPEGSEEEECRNGSETA